MTKFIFVSQQLEWANSRNGNSRFKSTRLHLLVGSVCGLRFAVTTKMSGDSRVISITFKGKCVNSQNPLSFLSTDFKFFHENNAKKVFLSKNDQNCVGKLQFWGQNHQN